jgi:hypothetical protein
VLLKQVGVRRELISFDKINFTSSEQINQFQLRIGIMDDVIDILQKTIKSVKK